MNQFVESLKRLYMHNLINEQRVIELFNNEKITKDEKDYILYIKQISMI